MTDFGDFFARATDGCHPYPYQRVLAEAIVRVLSAAGVRYLVAGGRDVEHLRMRLDDDEQA